MLSLLPTPSCPLIADAVSFMSHDNRRTCHSGQRKNICTLPLLFLLVIIAPMVNGVHMPWGSDWNAHHEHFKKSTSAAAAATANNNSNTSNARKHAPGGDQAPISLEKYLVPFDESPEILMRNTRVLTKFLQDEGSNTVLILPANYTFHLYNGVRIYGWHNATFLLDGELVFHRLVPDRAPAEVVRLKPTFNSTFDRSTHASPCFICVRCFDIVMSSSVSQQPHPKFTSNDYLTRRGRIYGSGSDWWGVPVYGYLKNHNIRPFLIVFKHSYSVDLSYLVLDEAPYYNLWLMNVSNMEVHHISITGRRTSELSHGLVDLSAFNTDGVDVSGHDIYIHDMDIWTQDDCIAIKDNHEGGRVTSNVLIERISASGLGLVIGSIAGTTVQNITFRDSYLYKTFKGIYMKFRIPTKESRAGLIENVLYQNITMDGTLQWPIWIGSAQQSGGPCSLFWPHLPWAECGLTPNATYRNITLKDITIRNPAGSPGVIMGGPEGTTVIDGLVFDNVRVIHDNATSLSTVATTSELSWDWSETAPKTRQSLESLFPSISYPVEDQIAARSIRMAHIFVLVTLSLLVVIVLGLLYRQCRQYQTARKQQADTIKTCEEAYFTNDTAEMSKESVYDPEIADTPTKEEIQPKKVEVEHSRSGHILSLIILFILTPLIFLSVWALVNEAVILPKINDRIEYFVCEGVKGGVAKGNTYPVPHCFRDETNKAINKSSGFHALTTGVMIHEIVVSIILTVAIGFYLLIMRCFMPKYRIHYKYVVSLIQDKFGRKSAVN